jgi:uncharacterized membrane protein YgdD (TMEM256/DUF423 family)
MYKGALITGAITAGLAVIIGAMGAHALETAIRGKENAADIMRIYKTAVEYQFYHAFALIAAGIIYSGFPARHIRLACTFFLTGIILFSGSLYLLTYVKINGGSLGAFNLLTPIGGVCFIIGWLLLVLGLLKKQ